MSSIPNAEDLYQILLKQLKEQQAINPDFQLAGLASGGAWIAERLAKDLQLPSHGVINVRAALNELFDYGRPAKVDLAVLADRHRRQLPVDATFKGARVKVADDQILVLEQGEDGRFGFTTESKQS
jgi:pyrimidine operon attenuation protein/uracil phosphoribosyltransferase